MVEGFIDLTARSIQARIHSGELTPIDAEETARALIRMLNGYLGDALAREEPIDRERVLDVVSTIWTRTLFPAHGG